MEIYRPMINYIAAAGLALAVALTPQSTLAEVNPCKTLETQLAQCQEEQRKKALTPEEQCSAARDNQIGNCINQYESTIAGRVELNPFGDLVTVTRSEEKINRDNKDASLAYELCRTQAELTEMRCLYSVRNEPRPEEAKATPKPKVHHKPKKKEPSYREQLSGYQSCRSGCKELARNNSCDIKYTQEITRHNSDGHFTSDERQQLAKNHKACKTEERRKSEECAQDCKKPKNPSPKRYEKGLYRI